MMKSYIVALLALVAFVAAQSNPFYVTNPLKGATLKAGQSINLSWLNGVDQKVQVNIIQGANPSTMTPTGVSFEVEGESGSYKYTVPSTLPATGVYAFQFQYKDESGSTVYAYSDPVSITGGSESSASGSSSASASASATASSTSAAATTTTAAATTTTVASSTSLVPSSSSNKPSSSQSASTTPTPSNNSGNSIKLTALALVAPAVVMALCA
ncbi:unnamed protein product [Cunninghamella blakesleeana]